VTDRAGRSRRDASFDERSPRERVAIFVWLNAVIVLLYALIIVLGSESVASPLRALLMGALLVLAIRLRRRQGRRLRFAVGLITVAFVACAVAAAASEKRLLQGLDGMATVLLVGMTIGLIGHSLISWRRTDLSTVLGVLSAYLLLALLFAGMNEFFAAFHPDYLNGASAPPSSSDLLYFSIITICTVGFGDITPATDVARAVTSVEAMVGQLYLVSVVAAVVSGWRAFEQLNAPPSD
jgi:Ion channel